MPATTFIGHFLGPDTHANRPSATGLPNGTQYVCTTHNKLERVVSGAWADYANLAGGGAAVATDPIFDAKGDIVAGTGADTAARVAAGTDGQVLTADSSLTPGVKWATPPAPAASAVTLLSTTTLASPGVFDVSSINQTYNDLILVVIARDATAAGLDALFMRFNNVSTTTYFHQRQRANSTTVDTTNAASANAISCGLLPGTSILANAFAVYTITIFGYASTAWFKTGRSEQSAQVSTAANGNYLETFAFTWDSTAAINRVQFAGSSAFTDNLVTGSQLRIYGRT